MKYNYILNTNDVEEWGDTAYNGMKISRNELERLASGWGMDIDELLGELITPYDNLTEVEYCDLVREYGLLCASLADGWTEEEVLDEFRHCISQGGDRFLNTLTEEQLRSFAESVTHEIDSLKEEKG